MRELIGHGRRTPLAARKTTPFRLREVGFHGNGLTPEFRGAGWMTIRNAIHEVHRT